MNRTTSSSSATSTSAGVVGRRTSARGAGDGGVDAAGAASDYEAALKLDEKFAPAHYYLAKDVCPIDKKKAALHFKRAAELAGSDEIGKRSAELAVKARSGKCD